MITQEQKEIMAEQAYDRLIKAAPKLLAACQDYQRVIEAVKDRLTGHDCADLGIYDLDSIIESAIESATS